MNVQNIQKKDGIKYKLLYINYENNERNGRSSTY